MTAVLPQGFLLCLSQGHLQIGPCRPTLTGRLGLDPGSDPGRVDQAGGQKAGATLRNLGKARAPGRRRPLGGLGGMPGALRQAAGTDRLSDQGRQRGRTGIGLDEASALLEALADLPWQPSRIGHRRHPEGHPHASNAQLLEALQRKAPLAQCIVTQMCFDAEAIVRWIDSVRNADVRLPVRIGLPGPVERRRLMELAWRTGVGSRFAT